MVVFVVFSFESKCLGRYCSVAIGRRVSLFFLFFFLDFKVLYQDTLINKIM